MLKEAKKALWVTDSEFDSEIALLLMAGAKDLEAAGVVLPGTVKLTIASNDTVTDNSTLKDPYVMRAILTYTRANFRNPPDYEKLEASYEAQKETLMHASDYTDYGDGTDYEDGGDGT